MNNNYNSKTSANCDLWHSQNLCFFHLHSQKFIQMHFTSLFAKSWHSSQSHGIYTRSIWCLWQLFESNRSTFRCWFIFFKLHTYTRHSTFYSQDIFFLLLITSIYHHFYSHDSCNNNSFGITNNVLRTLRLSTCEYTKYFRRHLNHLMWLTHAICIQWMCRTST